jgi:hypothetical protein
MNRTDKAVGWIFLIFRQPFPSMIELVLDPNAKQTRGEYILFQNIQKVRQ